MSFPSLKILGLAQAMTEIWCTFAEKGSCASISFCSLFTFYTTSSTQFCEWPPFPTIKPCFNLTDRIYSQPFSLIDYEFIKGSQEARKPRTPSEYSMKPAPFNSDHPNPIIVTAQSPDHTGNRNYSVNAPSTIGVPDQFTTSPAPNFAEPSFARPNLVPPYDPDSFFPRSHSSPLIPSGIFYLRSIGRRAYSSSSGFWEFHISRHRHSRYDDARPSRSRRRSSSGRSHSRRGNTRPSSSRRLYASRRSVSLPRFITAVRAIAGSDPREVNQQIDRALANKIARVTIKEELIRAATATEEARPGLARENARATPGLVRENRTASVTREDARATPTRDDARSTPTKDNARATKVRKDARGAIPIDDARANTARDHTRVTRTREYSRATRSEEDTSAAELWEAAIVAAWANELSKPDPLRENIRPASLPLRAFSQDPTRDLDENEPYEQRERPQLS